MSIKDQILPNKLPNHVAIIMDGNGRWAQQQGEERLFGHNFGVEAVREALKAAQELNVEYLTLYAFSTENWGRPKDEVDGLMDLLVRTIGQEVDELRGRTTERSSHHERTASRPGNSGRPRLKLNFASTASAPKSKTAGPSVISVVVESSNNQTLS